jgi:hypothetical protein
MLLPFKIMDLKPGDYFGERAILRDTGMKHSPASLPTM